MMNDMNETSVYAGIFRRILSYLIDTLVILFLLSPFWIWFFTGLFSEQSGNYLLGYALLIPIMVFIVQWCYYTIGWITPKGTIGCRVMRIRIVDELERTPLGYAAAALRCAGMTGELLLAGVGMLFVLFDPNKKSLHDMIAQSVVVIR